MSTLARALTVLVVVMGLGASLLVWEVFAGKGHGEPENSISKSEMEALVRDIDPMQRKTMAENKQQREKMLGGLRDIMIVASAARKAGFADRPLVKSELELMETAILAVSYDRKVNADKGPMPAFGFLSEDRVRAFWDEDKPSGPISWIWNQVNKRWHESEFDNFIAVKLALARERGQLAPDQEPTEEELTRARDDFARTQISYYDAKAKLASIPSMPEGPEKKEWEHFETVVRLQARLQQDQFLNAMYMKEVVAKEAVVTDAEVDAYIAAHPELSKKAEQLNTAKEVLKKAKSGADFGELAKEYSEDPGSKSRGGLYEGVVKGQFAPEFEQAADKLKPGAITPDLVETQYGYHIIKLIKRGEAKGASGVVQQTYDVSHILISTMMKDPDTPGASPIPVSQYVKSKLAREKQEAIMAKIRKDNPVSIAEDFEIPQATEEEIEKMQEEQKKRMLQMQQQQQQMRPAPGNAPQPQAPPQ